jgi:nitrogen fixation NifU-like protein
MTSLYETLVIERTRHPHHAGKPAHFDAQGSGANAICGDRVSIYVNRDSMDVHHESEGCAIMSASADLMADATIGKTTAQITQLAQDFAVAVATGTENPALGALNALASVSKYPSRIGCATLPWRALEEALQNV